MENINKKASREQLLYANTLEKGMIIGLLLMICTFALYVMQIISPVVPLDEVANYWRLPIHEYLSAINSNYLHEPAPAVGWSWLRLINKGDFLNFLPIAVLGGVTIVCYVAIIPGLFRRGDKAMGIMASAEALILSLAASGLLAVGH